jgi:riboflavin kinase/FMN adenylyltransferase
MRHITSLDEAKFKRPSVVTIGAFDGVHRGHQYLIRQLREQAETTGQVPVVLTFYPHPEMVLCGFRPGFYLTLPDEKARLLGDLGVELVVTHPFNEEIRHIRAADFVKNLLTHLKMASLWIGANFALGYKREGNVAFLQAQGQQLGFDVRVVDLMDAGGERVSSSRIRQALINGQVTEAGRLLGRPYRISGTVVKGDERGRTIGFPTANLDIKEEQAVPAGGVYAGWAQVGSDRYPSVANIGVRPTFDGIGKMTIEAHLLDYSGDLYGQEISLSFTERLRDEKKFSGIEELVSQIQRDIIKGRELLSAGR